jgi:hypothetical protein
MNYIPKYDWRYKTTGADKMADEDKNWVIDYESFFKALDKVAAADGTYDDLTAEVRSITAKKPDNKGLDGALCSKSKVYAKLAYVRSKWNLSITLKSKDTGAESQLAKHNQWKDKLLKHASIKTKSTKSE